jgi:hypothetical protein
VYSNKPHGRKTHSGWSLHSPVDTSWDNSWIMSRLVCTQSLLVFSLQSADRGTVGWHLSNSISRMRASITYIYQFQCVYCRLYVCIRISPPVTLEHDRGDNHPATCSILAVYSNKPYGRKTYSGWSLHPSVHVGILLTSRLYTYQKHRNVHTQQHDLQLAASTAEDSHWSTKQHGYSNLQCQSDWTRSLHWSTKQHGYS